MRKLALVLLFALPLFGYEVRSDKYACSVVVEHSEDVDRYLIRVTDVVAGKVIANEEIEATGASVEKTFDADGRTLRVMVRSMFGRLGAELEVRQNGLIVDELRGGWLTEPRPIPQLGETPLRVGDDVTAPVLVSRVEPEFTDEARNARVAGIVILETIIDRSGNVVDAKVLKSLPFGLDQKAIDAVRQWKYKPGTQNGEAVAVIFNVTVNFRRTD